jgi:hypothetical protein
MERISLEKSIELQYIALRSEILKRIEMRQQILAVTLTLAGIFLGLGLQNESVALIYPLIAAFLALGWAQNDFRIRDTANYIRENLEISMPYPQYETHMQNERKAKRGGLGSWSFIILSHGGIFLLTQLFAIGVEVSMFSFKPFKYFLFVVDGIATTFVIWLLIKTRTITDVSSKPDPARAG